MNENFVQKLVSIQNGLKCKKAKRNNFGNFNYRSCEDIFESVKPLLLEQGLLMYFSDEIQSINGFNYIKATVTITDGVNSISSHGWAKESDAKKGMDSSQITGSGLSYARKYALGGALLIDDSTDPDSMDNSSPQKKQATKPVSSPPKTVLTEDKTRSAYIARINQLTQNMTKSQKEKAIKAASFDADGYIDNINAMTKNGVQLNSDQLLKLGQKLAENIAKETNDGGVA